VLIGLAKIVFIGLGGSSVVLHARWGDLVAPGCCSKLRLAS